MHDVRSFLCMDILIILVYINVYFSHFYSMQLKILSRYETYNQVLNSKTDDVDFYYIRRIVCEFILYIRIYLNR